MPAPLISLPSKQIPNACQKLSAGSPNSSGIKKFHTSIVTNDTTIKTTARSKMPAIPTPTKEVIVSVFLIVNLLYHRSGVQLRGGGYSPPTILNTSFTSG